MFSVHVLSHDAVSRRKVDQSPTSPSRPTHGKNRCQGDSRRYGHESGQSPLRAFGQMVSNALR